MLGAMAGKAIEVLGDVTGVDSVTQQGRETAERYLRDASDLYLKPQTSSYKDVEDFRSGMNYVASILGEQAPQLAADAAAATVGALTGAGVGAVPAVMARRGAVAAAMRAVAGGSAAAGAKRGAMSSMFTQALGESAMELEAKGITDRGAAIVAAFAKMGADYAGTMAMFRTAKRMAFDGNAVTARVILGEAAKSIGWEGGTEALQTVIDKAAVAYHKDGYDIFSDKNIEEIINSAIAGAIVGGTVSGTAGGGRMAVDKLFGKRMKTQVPLRSKRMQPLLLERMQPLRLKRMQLLRLKRMRLRLPKQRLFLRVLSPALSTSMSCFSTSMRWLLKRMRLRLPMVLRLPKHLLFLLGSSPALSTSMS